MWSFALAKQVDQITKLRARQKQIQARIEKRKKEEAK